MLVDRVLGCFFMVLATGAIWHAQTLVVPFMTDPIGPRVFPTIVAIVLGICGVVLLVRPHKTSLEFRRIGRVAVLAFASLVYPLVLQPLGFVPATAVLCLVGALAFEARPLGAAAAAVVTAFAFWLLLDRLLDLPLPQGPLGL